ncbi:Hypothetical predicted protein [Mytilus galloprovincialis]|uniref:NodB homology domain-containing protein n=1 Tax=Mytilus galloprovincialis TaxID=29158 RepID=A0A8B6EHD4_MYTGA|nr:Hypothetical predicted protein [Mytilus galloprovincialis]
MKVFVYLAVLIGLVYGQCDPAGNCSPPDCRCFKDNTTPGGLQPDEIPQMVVITMDYALNSEFAELYDQLFTTTNPNDCPTLGTFYLQDMNTDYDVVKAYYDRGFEIGVSSVDGTIPKDEVGWVDLIKTVKTKITGAGINGDDVRGYRPPQLNFGGTEEFIGIGDNGLVYDAGCVTSEYDTASTFKWPFTYDFPEGATCNGQSMPVDKEFKGKWELIIPDFTFTNDTKCEVPQGCTNVETKTDAFNILYDNFIAHYEGSRTPYVVIIDAAWMKTDFKREGTVEFMDYVRAGFPDTWVITAWQSLQWVQNPTPTSNISSFAPWSC